MKDAIKRGTFFTYYERITIFSKKLKWTNKYLYNFSTCYRLVFVIIYLSSQANGHEVQRSFPTQSELGDAIVCGKIQITAKHYKLNKQIIMGSYGFLHCQVYVMTGVLSNWDQTRMENGSANCSCSLLIMQNEKDLDMQKNTIYSEKQMRFDR